MPLPCDHNQYPISGMSCQESEHSPQPLSEHTLARIHRFPRIRCTRKGRFSNTKQEDSVPQASFFEEKKRARKIRNRDAAQRARDKAKRKFEDLAEQVERLRAENQALKKGVSPVCIHCMQRGVIKDQHIESSISDNPVNSVVYPLPVHCNPQFQRVPNVAILPFPFFFCLLAIVFCIVGLLPTSFSDGVNNDIRFLQGTVSFGVGAPKGNLRKEPQADPKEKQHPKKTTTS